MKLYTRNELQDGRMFFDKQPPRYMTVFILFLVLFLVSSVIGAQFVKRPYVVKAQGTISVDGTSYLSTKTQGVITEIHAESGQFVEVGDVILILSSGTEGLQKSVVEAQIKDLEDTLFVMDKYEEALEQKENSLSQTGKELEYYGKVAYYLDILSQETYDDNKSNSSITERKTELAELKTEIKDLETELDNVSEQITENEAVNKKLTQKLNEKESMQQDLLEEVTKLEGELALDDADEVHFQTLEEKQAELDQLTEAIDKERLEAENNLNQENLMEQKMELESDLEMKRSEVKGFEDEIKQLNEQAESPYSQAEQTRLQLVSELGEKRSQIQNQLTELRANEGVATEQDTVHVVTATKSGVLHYLQPMSVGMSLQQNQVVGEIATDEEGFYVDAYIQAQDRSRVTVGQSVNVAVLGINNYRFGTISGTVEFIEPGTIQNETAKGVISLYRATVSLTEESLSSKSGEIIDLVRSMPVEARVVYQEESYLDWLLDLLNLKSS